MVKHVSFIIGCIILSLSVTLIVPTNCLPIEENGQKETNFSESRSKRQVASSSANSAAKASATSSSQTVSQFNPLSVLLPYLARGGQAMRPPTSSGGPGGPGGLTNLLTFGLNPVFGSLGGILGNLGNTVNGVVDKVGDVVPPADPLVKILEKIITTLLGGGGGIKPFPGMSKPLPSLPPLPPYLIELFSPTQQIKQTVSTTSTSSASSQANALAASKG